MDVIATVSEMEAARAKVPRRVGLVPTMGYLHEGHLSLVRRARTESDCVVVSIFVNPAQFGPGEDFDRYPRDAERDLRLLEGEGVDAVFAPAVEEMYPPGFGEWVELHGPVVERLEGVTRPGHFRGVTTVVARLFRIVRPERAYFGRKDGQQLVVVRRMVAELKLPPEIVAVPTMREADGLALSSRNVYLSGEERMAALALSRGLFRAERLFQEGTREAETLRDSVRREVAGERLLTLEYVSVSDERTFEEFEEMKTVDGPALLLVAVRVGSTRLIDNVPLVV